MTSRSRAKGSQFERDLVAYLKLHGFPYAERAYGAGRPQDVGDIDGLLGMVIEAKNQREFSLAAWMDEAVKEAGHVGHETRPILVVKRRQRDVGHSYVIEPLWSWSHHNSEEPPVT